MKREAVLKVILLVIMGVVLFAKPVSVFAVSSNPTDLNDFWEDQGSLDDIQKEETPTPEPTTPTTPTPEPTTPSTPITPETTKPSTSTTPTTNNTNTDKELPKAGLVEDTMMIVSIVALLGVAIYTFIKISDYSNI